MNLLLVNYACVRSGGAAGQPTQMERGNKCASHLVSWGEQKGRSLSLAIKLPRTEELHLTPLPTADRAGRWPSLSLPAQPLSSHAVDATAIILQRTNSQPSSKDMDGENGPNLKFCMLRATGYCETCLKIDRNKSQDEQSSNSGSTSDHSGGDETGQRLLTTREEQEKILYPNRKRPHLAGHGDAEQDFNNAQRIATNQAQGQQNFAVSSVAAMKKAPIKPKPQYPGEDWLFYEAPKSHGTSGASGSVSSTQQPVAGPFSASIQDHTSNQNLKLNEATKNNDDRPALVRKGYCLMCEINFENIDEHLGKWHTFFNGDPSHYYRISVFQFKLVLFYNGTNLKEELGKCHNCKKVFYNHRLNNHLCCPAEKPNREWGYCLMCKFNFEDLCEHKKCMHGNNQIYSTRKIFEKWTLLPEKTWDDLELTKCKLCLMPIYKYQAGFHQC
ncbi:Hypothetical predicted protein [Cloeon dipterum]|uniref:Uncharacterized protein n=1 Tax=Cloeon dipterum TaxID=197152 RepID=A0A8S1DIH6_9INSE|nr:Hypothetical predicted protein [Cloeon dipterum]